MGNERMPVSKLARITLLITILSGCTGHDVGRLKCDDVRWKDIDTIENGWTYEQVIDVLGEPYNVTGAYGDEMTWLLTPGGTSCGTQRTRKLTLKFDMYRRTYGIPRQGASKLIVDDSP